MASDTSIRSGPAVLFIGSAALLLGALASQYLGGLYPCPLCIYQRYPHGAVLALSLAAFLVPAPRARVALILAAVLALLAGAAIAAFHVGVEQKWWQGLAACEGGTTFGDPDMTFEQMRQLAESGPPPRCDEIQWSLFGISLAGYNFIFSLAIAAYGLRWVLYGRKAGR